MNILYTKFRQTFTCLAVIIVLAACITVSVQAQSFGRVMGFENNMVRINWGTNDGLVQGILLNVFQEVAIYHPVTRERFGSSESIVGTIEVAECFPDYSFARIVDSTEQIRIGNIVRISFDSPDFSSDEGEAEKGTIINVNNRLVKFNMGRFDGVENNLIFDVFRYLGPSRHPVTGEQVEPENLYIGKVVVMSVEDKEALAQIITQEREITTGDHVLLSAQQESDLEIMPRQQQAAVQAATPEVQQEEPQKLPETISPPDNVVGTVTRVADRDIFFIWRGDYDFSAGRVFGVFRKEELRHPETNRVIGNPLILLGKISLVESIGEVGRGAVLSSDADILPQDLIGLTEGETVQSGQVVTPANAEEVYQARRSDLLEQAQDLTEQVQQIQGEMTVLRSTLDRLDRIDRELSAQKALTNSMNQSLEEIKMLLRGEGFPVESAELIPSRANVERIEMPGSESNVLRLKYTDDIAVKLELIDKTLLVSLDVDSLGRTRMVSSMPTEAARPGIPADTTHVPPDTITGTGLIETVGEEEAAGKPFYSNWIFLSVVILILIGAAGALYFLLVLKKKKTGAPEGDEEEGGEIEDVDEDEFGGEGFGEEEEEIESFDEEL